MVEEIMQAAMVEEIMQVATVAATVVAATVVLILNLTLLIQINPQEQKVGKIEVMETLRKILNMKVAELGEKEEFQMKVIHQIKRISNPILQV